MEDKRKQVAMQATLNQWDAHRLRILQATEQPQCLTKKQQLWKTKENR